MCGAVVCVWLWCDEVSVYGTVMCGSLRACSVSTRCAGVVSDCGVCDCEV